MKNNDYSDLNNKQTYRCHRQKIAVIINWR